MTLREAINFVVLAVLLVRSLVPAGFMVQAAHAADSPFEIVICTASGPKVLHSDSKAPAPQSQQAVDEALCSFASTGATALVDEPRSLATEVAYARVTYTLAVAQFADTPKPGAQSARGPPSQLI